MNNMIELIRCVWSCRRFSVLLFLWFVAHQVQAEQRTVCLLPLTTSDAGSNDLIQSPTSTSHGFDPELHLGKKDAGWSAYMRLWEAHHEDPSNLEVRRFLGIPTTEPFVFQARRGRSSPRWLAWRPGTYAQVDTSHFSIFSSADEKTTRQVAADLEMCFWVWTQLFFPLWEGAAQVASAFEDFQPSDSISDYLAATRPRLSIRRQFQVVLLKDAEQYQKTLQAEGPGIELSTGFYSDSLRTIFLYGVDGEAAETRRHELTHQLFREATRSGLGQESPGEKSDFWMVEGIAGYMESLVIGDRHATVGGWDSPRLQYARYRVLAGGDQIPPAELMSDGQKDAQNRSDLSRWYSHSIAHIHSLMDGNDAQARHWLYERLARLYRSRSGMSPLEESDAVESRLLQSWGDGLRRYLQLNAKTLVSYPAQHPLRVLCLTGCEIDEAALQSIPPSNEMTWLDLARLPIRNESVMRLVPQPEKLQQLTLEVTRADDSLGPWLQRAADLRELDMSWTKVGDDFLQSIKDCKEIEVLWMTGTQLTDQSVEVLLKFPQLESLDVQRSQITEAGLERIRQARPNLQLNPLELRLP